MGVGIFVGVPVGVEPMLEQYSFCQLFITEQGTRLEVVLPKTLLEVFGGNWRAIIKQTKERIEEREARIRGAFFSFTM